ncbi:RidA family protein [uncultured Brevundimonas sp.]|uniref:RidA family protein n=1 Tax=uncultured Brevundimonas sp. TaxID=213418 RepID=UPI0025F53C14|nr:RidA family protein [uncultured Brevundimonas sp.]
MRQTISSGSPMEEIAAYSRAVIDGGFVFVSGTVGVDPETRELPDDFTAQARNAFLIIERALDQAGASLDQTTHVRLFVSDRANLPAIVPVLQEKFGKSRPAQTMIIADLPDPKALLEVEVTVRLNAYELEKPI